MWPEECSAQMTEQTETIHLMSFNITQHLTGCKGQINVTVIFIIHFIIKLRGNLPKIYWEFIKWMEGEEQAVGIKAEG